MVNTHVSGDSQHILIGADVGKKLEESCVLDFTNTEICLGSQLSTKVGKICSLRMFTRNNLALSFIICFFNEASNILCDLVLEGIETVVLSILADNGF